MHEFRTASTKANWDGWGWEDARPCPVAFSLAGSKENFGHAFAALLFAVDLATRASGRLFVDGDFWAGTGGVWPQDSRQQPEILPLGVSEV